MIRVIKWPVKLQTYAVAKLCDPHSHLQRLALKKKEKPCAVTAEKTRINLGARHRKRWTQMNANSMQRWEFFFFWSGGQAVWSLPFTRPHVAAVSIIPALPFQISVSDLLMQEHKHSRGLRSVSTAHALVCTDTYGYTFPLPSPEWLFETLLVAPLPVSLSKWL